MSDPEDGASTASDADATEPAVPAPAETPTRTRPAGRTVPAGAFIIAIMLAMALGIVAVYSLATGSDSDGDISAELQAAQEAAGRFGDRFLTIRYDDIDGWRTDVRALTTGGFAAEVDQVEASFREIMGSTEMVATAQVTDIFMGNLDRGSVSAVLLYDRNVASTEGTQTDSDRYMQVNLDLVDGVWLVDQVFDISTLGRVGTADGGDPAAPTTSPPTTVGG